MPLYEFKCLDKRCKVTVFDKFRSHKEASQGAICPSCGKKARRMYSTAGFKIDFKAGFDPGQGEWFDSAAQRDESAARANIRRIKD